MVMSPVPMNNDRDGPDKNNEEDNDIGALDAPQFIIAADSSDSEFDDDEPENLGYQLLPQDPEMGNEAEDEETEVEPDSQPSPNLNPMDQTIVNSMETHDYAAGFGSSQFNVSQHFLCACMCDCHLGVMCATMHA